ncbi:uncharacterized protein PHACADRAFT_160625 [Phanerochaete carnosa HHB-10118-sp]|uniref:Peptidase A1 domain-containing protein n=1 Tax=Phanerochaete carnosa (strain HHB-10118-sp) TaxID=650164 RepID=K5X2Q1_PHACS|nr:uncharacterized protein PHACADRAFT_160625 [Phanerochaete carnosa HHB-10118-sp]EKM57087.1 hypothetical protein PHACADRAFT_160625 [Phanerochaete carnosa HHB-10118-sp]
MLRLYTFLLLTLTLTATAYPLASISHINPITIPLARYLNLTGGAAKILENDRARANALKLGSFAKDPAAPVPVANAATSYTVQVGVGSPAQTYNLLVDTGSSNTWVGANKTKPYRPSKSSSRTPDEVAVKYGSGSFSGELWNDTVIIGSNGALTISKQGVAAAIMSTGFEGSNIDGILGIGPTDLTLGTIKDDPKKTIPTVTDTAQTDGVISSREVGVFFAPTTSSDSNNGELTFGGVNPSKFTGSLNYVDITSTSPASNYVGIDQSITYGSPSGTQILGTTSGIVDTGTTLLLIATDAFSQYKTLTNAVADKATGLLKIAPAQYDNLQSLFFTIGGETYEFTKDAQTWPRSLNEQVGGDANSIYLIVGDVGSKSGQGLDFINGMSFLERFYTVYDSDNSRFGIAKTAQTLAICN